MSLHSRRSFLKGNAAVAVAAALPLHSLAQAPDDGPSFDAAAVPFTKTLSQFVVQSSYDQLNPDAVMAAKRGIIDTLAVTFGAHDEDVTRILQRFVREETSRDEATVIGGRIKTNAAFAGYVNGAMSHALDYDNVIHVDNVWMGHPSVVVLPAALALAEKRNLSGKDLLLAYSLGIEVYTKVGLLCGNTPYEDGWHNTSYLGTMAAAAVGSRLLGLDLRQTERCFGIAASSAGGLRQNFGTMTKPLHAGLAARAGIEAAELAAMGFTGSEQIFETKLGYRNVFAGSHGSIKGRIPFGDNALTPEQFEALLGKPWNVATPGMAYKICPSCRSSHYALEAGLDFRRDHPFEVRDIVEIECRVPSDMGDVLFYHEPKKGLEGKFSLEYVLGRTLLDGVPRTTDFTDERVNDPVVKVVMRTMKWIPFNRPPKDPGFPTFVFKSRDGKLYQTKIEHLTGEPEHPVSNEILLAKFDDLSGPVLSPDARSQAKRMVFDLENLTAVRSLASVLQG